MNNLEFIKYNYTIETINLLNAIPKYKTGANI